MSRAGSMGNIKFEHIRWDKDHMIIVIPKHKGDRSGTDRKVGLCKSYLPRDMSFLDVRNTSVI